MLTLNFSKKCGRMFYKYAKFKIGSSEDLYLMNFWLNLISLTNNAPVNVKPQGKEARHTPGDLTFCFRILTNSPALGQHVLSNLSYIYGILSSLGNHFVSKTLHMGKDKFLKSSGYAWSPTLRLNIDWCINLA